jgi:hypothetical protein
MIFNDIIFFKKVGTRKFLTNFFCDFFEWKIFYFFKVAKKIQ